MPSYPYVCSKCKKRFTVQMAMTEHETRKVRCPKCNSLRVTQQFESFFAKTSKKS